jgi:hypothetical protein
MDYRDFFGFDREFSRISKEMSDALRGFSFAHEETWAQVIGNSDHIRQAFMPAADQLLKGIFDPPLDAFRAQFATSHLDSIIRDSFLGVGESIANLTSNIGRIEDMLPKVLDARSLFPAIGVGSFIRPLPDLSPLQEWIEEMAAEEGGNLLDAQGFGFSRHLFTKRFLARMAWIAPNARGAAVTNRLLGHTRKAKFEQELCALFQSSSILGRRWHIVERALHAHTNRDYVLAVPTLLAQVEGVIGDAFVLKKDVIIRGKQLYEKGADGKIKLDRHGNPIKILGAKRLLKVVDFGGHPLLAAIADVLMDGLIDTRNGILHGRDMNYRRPGVSLQALLILYSVAPDIAAFEQGEFETE